MDNFNLKKFLTENKLTHTSHLREGFHSPADPNTVAYNRVKSEWDAGNISDRRYTNMKWMDLPDETQKELYNKYKDDYYEDTMDVDTSGETYDYEMSEEIPSPNPEADEIDLEDLEAASDYYDNMKESKLTKSSLRAKIKEMVLAEMNLNISDETPESEEDFLAELEGMLNEADEFNMNKSSRIAEFITALNRLVDDYHAELYLNDDLFAAIEMVIKAAKEEAMNLDEAKKDKEEVDTEEATDDITVDDTETIDTTTTTEVDPDVKAVQDALTQAQAVAQKLGDPKLTDQIGNTITFFTRTHVVDKGAVAENLKEGYDRVSKENISDYWSIMVDNQPEDVKEILTNLTTGVLSYDDFITNTMDDVYDSFKDELYDDLDESKKSVNESMFPMLKKIIK